MRVLTIKGYLVFKKKFKGAERGGMRMERKRNADAKGSRSCQGRYFYCNSNDIRNQSYGLSGLVKKLF